MTIKRQYSSPNCKLILEGLSQNTDSSPLNGLPLMSILINSECHFLNSDKIISGGLDFFKNFVKAVSSYSQEFLSGIPHPIETHSDTDKVVLQKVEGKDLHHLIWESPDNNEKVEMDLTTVQLFDLVETVDQFLADPLTLPDIKWNVQPVSRRYRQIDEPLVKRATPVGLGVAGLALTGVALLFAPIPEEMKDPNRQPSPQPNPSETLPNTQAPNSGEPTPQPNQEK